MLKHTEPSSFVLWRAYSGEIGTPVLFSEFRKTDGTSKWIQMFNLPLNAVPRCLINFFFLWKWKHKYISKLLKLINSILVGHLFIYLFTYSFLFLCRSFKKNLDWKWKKKLVKEDDSKICYQYTLFLDGVK